VLLTKKAGSIVNEVEVGDMAWSNELVMHVIEVKTNGPSGDLSSINRRFYDSVSEINALLKPEGAMLLGTAMHPLMDPLKETKLWPHDDRAIYDAYHRIFSCEGHGWSNLQSVHINLPFYDDEEFGRLHAAIRMVLPILPALAASSPLCEGRLTDVMDTRLDFYRQNQKAVPSITGHVIPEQAFTKEAYDRVIFQKMYRDIAPFDPESILQEEWLNSRGAIARWDRNAIEIRVLDIQESPRMDSAVIAATVALVKGLVEGRYISQKEQESWHELDLEVVFNACVKRGGDALLTNQAYLSAFGVNKGPVTGRELWAHIVTQLKDELAQWEGELKVLIEQGTLAKRIASKLQEVRDVAVVYRRLAECLDRNEVF
jgi:gamma-glutamyl:cysteine ligase YbdK (ATP-grasp superfamily)